MVSGVVSKVKNVVSPPPAPAQQSSPEAVEESGVEPAQEGIINKKNIF